MSSQAMEWRVPEMGALMAAAVKCFGQEPAEILRPFDDIVRQLIAAIGFRWEML